MPIPRCQCWDFQVAVLSIFQDKDIKDKSLSWKWTNSTKEIINFTYCNFAIAIWCYTLFYKQPIYQQSQAWKVKQMLRNTLRLDFCYSKIIHIPPDHPKIIGHILKIKQKSKCACIHEIIQLIIIKMEMKMKIRSHRQDINRPRLYMDTNIVNIESVSVWLCLYVLSNT